MEFFWGRFFRNQFRKKRRN